MIEPRMPTTLPSPVDRTEFRFVAVDAAGREWRWNDDELVWACVDDGTDVESGSDSTPAVLH